MSSLIIPIGVGTQAGVDSASTPSTWQKWYRITHCALFALGWVSSCLPAPLWKGYVYVIFPTYLVVGSLFGNTEELDSDSAISDPELRERLATLCQNIYRSLFFASAMTLCSPGPHYNRWDLFVQYGIGAVLSGEMIECISQPQLGYASAIPKRDAWISDFCKQFFGMLSITFFLLSLPISCIGWVGAGASCIQISMLSRLFASMAMVWDQFRKEENQDLSVACLLLLFIGLIISQTTGNSVLGQFGLLNLFAASLAMVTNGWEEEVSKSTIIAFAGLLASLIGAWQLEGLLLVVAFCLWIAIARLWSLNFTEQAEGPNNTDELMEDIRRQSEGHIAHLKSLVENAEKESTKLRARLSEYPVQNPS